jgi:hypothetical protein
MILKNKYQHFPLPPVGEGQGRGAGEREVRGYRKHEYLR